MEKYGPARHATNDNIIDTCALHAGITKATDTRSEFVINIAFPLQQWLRERTVILRYLSCYLHGVTGQYGPGPSVFRFMNRVNK